MKKFIDKTVSLKRLSSQFGRFAGGGGGAAYETFKSIPLNENNFKKSLNHRIHYDDEINPFQITANSSKSGSKNIIYKSEHVASTRSGLRDFAILHLAALYPLTAGGISVAIGVPVVGLSIYKLYENFLKETKRNLVSELEYTPGKLRFTLLTHLGGFRTVEEDLNNIEIVDASHIDKLLLTDPFWPTRTELDTRVIFHNKNTNENYCFDKHGEWTLETVV